MDLSDSEKLIIHCKETLASVKQDNIISLQLLQKLSSKINEQQKVIQLLTDNIEKLEKNKRIEHRAEPPIAKRQRQAAIAAATNLKQVRKIPAKVSTNNNQGPSKCPKNNLSNTSTPKTLQNDSIATPDKESLKPNCEEDNELENEKWIQVLPRRNHPKRTIIKGTATNTKLFSGVDLPKFVHGCYFNVDSTPDKLLEHLKSIESANYTVEKISSKHDTYKSYKIGIPSSIYDKIMDPNCWPLNIALNKWQPFLAKRGSKRQSDDSTIAEPNAK
ncbi:hypothetical protein O0L34_g15235 [Tuta absoluta]|nr:hypothetical protein O0L34_g15235 [Tuta absoluta]